MAGKMKRVLRVSVLVCLLAAASAGVAAGELGVSVAEEGESVVIEVSSDGEPADGANVTVSGVDGETDLDGAYVTGPEGRVVFSENMTENLSGVVYLRITVDYEGSYRSALSSVTRSPDFDDAGLGRRLSKTLSESVAETQGEVEGRLKVREAFRPIGATNRAHLLSTSVNERLIQLGEARFELRVVGNKYATGDISDEQYYIQTVHRSGQVMYLEAYVPYAAQALADVDEDALERDGVDEEELTALLEEVESGEQIDGDRRIR